MTTRGRGRSPPPMKNIADLVAVVRPAIANSDLVTRWQQNADENEVDQASVYGPGRARIHGYPFLQTEVPDARARGDSFARAPFLCEGPVALQDRARAERALVDELEVDLIPDAIEQTWSAPRNDRMRDEGLPVDVPVRREHGWEIHPAESDTSLRLILEPPDGVDDAPRMNSTFQSTASMVPDATTFRIGVHHL